MNYKRKIISCLLGFNFVFIIASAAVTGSLVNNKTTLTPMLNEQVTNQKITVPTTTTYQSKYGTIFGTAIINNINAQKPQPSKPLTLASTTDPTDLAKVVTLKVNSNQKIDLTTDILEGLTSLTALTIKGNISDIKTATKQSNVFLYSNQKLKKLSIVSDNDIKIDTSFLANNKQLEQLTLDLNSSTFINSSSTTTHSIDTSFLENSYQNLVSLNLDLTNLNGFLAPSALGSKHAFCDMVNLKNLTLQTTDFETMYLPNTKTPIETLNIFKNLSKLTNLTISTDNEMKISFTNPSQDVFGGLVNLTDIQLNGSLKSLPNDCFKNNGKLTNIDLSSNAFSDIPAAVNISSLKTLNMQSNTNISTINFNNLNNATNVSTLNFSDIPKLIFGSWTYSNNPQPITLLLSGDKIANIPNVILNATNIVNLDLSNNIINFTNSSQFGNNNIIKTLDLSNNRIVSTHIGSVFQDVTNLVDINLSNNMLDTIPNSIFNNSLLLKKVDLSHNNIQTIEANAFQNNQQISTLDLSYNKINKIILQTFNSLINMTKLDLGYNQLVNFPNGVFDKNLHLETLSLNDNKLTSLPIDSIAKLSDKLVIDVSNNFLAGDLSKYQKNTKQNWNFAGNKDNSEASHRYTHITIIVMSVLASLLVVVLICISLWRSAKKRERLDKQNAIEVDPDEGY